MSHLKDYEYVIEISKKGGISQAADSLGMSQPTLSKYIKKLEGELGVELFDRSTVPLRLTEAGERFVAAGLRVIDMERQLQKQLEDIKLNKSSTVNVGISPSRAPYLIPAIIELFRRRLPSARVVIKERTTSELSSLLREGELDLVISLLDAESMNFERIDLFCEDVLIAMPASQDTDGASALDILKSSTLIQVGKGLNLYRTMHEITDALDIPSPQIECQSIESALALVKRGIGITLVPSYVAKYGTREQNQALRFLPLTDLGSGDINKRQVCLFYRKEQFLTETEKEFISCVCEITGC
jgi:DNA-binding transcriptional LysR family regulator